MGYTTLYILFCVLVGVNTKTLKIGLYNYLPDLADDQLESYRLFVKSKWIAKNPNIDVELHVNWKTYDPYGDLDVYLGDGDNSFDLIETDMVRAPELIGKVLEMNEKTMNDTVDIENYFEANIDSVRYGKNYFGFPTLTCGNFITQLQKDGESFIELNDRNYKEFISSLRNAKDASVSNQTCGLPRSKCSNSKFIRLLSGKINDTDGDGWYLPYIYLDAFMDTKGGEQLGKEIQNVLNEKPNAEVIQQLKTFFGFFRDNCGAFDQVDIIDDVVAREGGHYFGFSESLSKILKKSKYVNMKVRKVFTPPFGESNHALLYTDALVINKKKFKNADMDTRKAVIEFVKFFTSDSFRREFVMGENLKPNRVLYLLVPNKNFYKETSNPVYKTYSNILEKGINAPELYENDRKKMQSILVRYIFPDERNEYNEYN